MKSKCIGISGLLFGHDFAVEVVRDAPNLTGTFKGSVFALEAMSPVHSVVVFCRRCGELAGADQPMPAGPLPLAAQGEKL